ncbi:hypothetical protein [Microcoleus sp. EPA2]|uniref:hypothetical protein n=1 Tax=Microcoleus sp. EPA2 TaxID=2841654 RepID=UPI00312B4647
MQEEPPVDPYLEEICAGYTDREKVEIQQYLTEWDAGTYGSVAQSILDHATRKDFAPLKYLRKAHNFNRKGSVRVPKTGYRWDGSAVYRKGGEYLIVRPDSSGVEKIVTYGINEE